MAVGERRVADDVALAGCEYKLLGGSEKNACEGTELTRERGEGVDALELSEKFCKKYSIKIKNKRLFIGLC